MSYDKMPFWERGVGGMKNENEIKDQSEASYFFVQGAQ